MWLPDNVAVLIDNLYCDNDSRRWREEEGIKELKKIHPAIFWFFHTPSLPRKVKKSRSAWFSIPVQVFMPFYHLLVTRHRWQRLPTLMTLIPSLHPSPLRQIKSRQKGSLSVSVRLDRSSVSAFQSGEGTTSTTTHHFNYTTIQTMFSCCSRTQYVSRYASALLTFQYHVIWKPALHLLPLFIIKRNAFLWLSNTAYKRLCLSLISQRANTNISIAESWQQTSDTKAASQRVTRWRTLNDRLSLSLACEVHYQCGPLW